MKPQNKIVAISLQGKDRLKMFAQYDGEQLLLIDAQKITGIFATRKEALIKDVQTLVKKGYTVVVDEKTSIIAEYANPINLETVGHDGRVNFYNALDFYFQMMDMGNISFPDKCKPFRIKEETVDKTFDDQGRVKYIINFDDFKAGHRAVLLCVMAAEFEPMGANYLEKMYEKVGLVKNNDPLSRFHAITLGVDQSEREKWDKVRGW